MTLNTATSYSYIQELSCLFNFVILHHIINELFRKWVSIAPYNTYNIQAESVFVLRENQRCLWKIFTCHQVFFSVHLKDSPAQPLIIYRSFINCERWNFFGPSKIIKSMFILLNGHITICPIYVDVEYQIVVHFLVELSRSYQVCLPINCAFCLVHWAILMTYLAL